MQWMEGSGYYHNDYAIGSKILTTKHNNNNPQLQRFNISIRIGPAHAMRFLFSCEHNINWTQ
jgi:hypothetical protein